MGGIELARISGEVDWQQYSLTLPAGGRTVQWNYSKDSSLAVGQDRGWVDQVQFVPISGCPATLSASNASHPSDSSTGLVNVAIAPGCPWGVFNQNSWISIVSGSNTTGNGSLAYTVAANPTAYNRIGNVQIADQVFVVTQLGITVPQSNCFYTVSPNGFGPGSYAGFTGTVFVDTPSSCEWNVINTNSWITITSSLTNFGSGQATFSVSQNPAPVARSGRIHVAGQIVTINQSAAPLCPITLSPGSASHSSSSATGLVSVTAAAGCAWTVFSSNSWISIVSPTSGSGNGSVTYIVEANPTPSVRSGKVWIRNQSFSVTQSGASPGCTISISPGSGTHTYGAATNVISVTTQAGCPWTVFNTNAWVTILSSVSNSSSGQVIYSISSNNTSAARLGFIRVDGQVFAISQTGHPGTNNIPLPEALDTSGTPLVWITGGTIPWLGQAFVSHDGLDAAQCAAPAGSGSGSGGLQTTVTGPGTLSFWWKVSSEANNDTLRLYVNGVAQAGISGEVDWQQSTLTLPAGSQALEWRYSKNATISAGQDRGWVDQVQYVPDGCAISLSPASASHGSSSYTGIVSVTAWSCAWGVVNTNPWVTILSGTTTNEAGSGTLRYKVTANPSTFARSGNIRIGGQQFFLTQWGTSGPGTNTARLHFMGRTQTNATLSVQGEAGKMYVVECSEDLIQWIPISTNSAPSTFTDAAATHLTASIGRWRFRDSADFGQSLARTFERRSVFLPILLGVLSPSGGWPFFPV